MENEAERFVQSDEDAVVTNRIFTEDEIADVWMGHGSVRGARIPISIFTPFEQSDPAGATRGACICELPER